jgi:hypothetical protein
VEATPIRMPKPMSCQVGVTQTNGTSAERMRRPAIDE